MDTNLIVPWTDYIPHTPTRKQLGFLLLDTPEALYGGAAGGGKSDALLMAALQYVHVPGYSALLLRKTYSDLALPGALMSRAVEWLAPSDATWSGNSKRWMFPSGASLTFGYLDQAGSEYRYQSSEFQYIGFDELTQFRENQYRYLFSRLRRLEGQPVPLRMRAASNPGGVGHEWVRQRFVDKDVRNYDRIFIPATLADNPYLDQQAYLMSLDQLDPITKRQLLNGDWTARHGGDKFHREWFDIVDAVPAGLTKIRYWDMAATEPKGNRDPDYTAGALLGLSSEGITYIIDVRRMRGSPGAVERHVRITAETDSPEVTITMEQEPGASGVANIDHFRRKILQGYTFYPDRVSGSKEVRASPLSSQAEAGNVKLVRGPWIPDFLDEAETFPTGDHDDMVDAVSGAYNRLTFKGRPGVRWLVG